jgi:hypothetical protein
MNDYTKKGDRRMDELIRDVEKSVAALERALEERQDEEVKELALLNELPARLLTCYNRLAIAQ